MSYVETHMRESLKDHVLEQVLDAEKFKAFYLKRPGNGRMCSTMVLFTPEGIALMGDLTPEHNGTVSCYGYGLDWFVGNLSEDYLCEKFLAKGWHADLAQDELLDLAKEILEGKHEDSFHETRAIEKAREERDALLEQEGTEGWGERVSRAKSRLNSLRMDLSRKMKDLVGSLEDGSMEGNEFAEEWRELMEWEDSEGTPGWGYKPSEAGWLCAIQQKFAELYSLKRELVESAKAEVKP